MQEVRGSTPLFSTRARLLRALTFMTFFVYIIYSESLARFYTDTTNNVHNRIEEHNSNKYPNSFTSKGIPWELFLAIKCDSSGQAYKLEKFIKKMKSSMFIKRLKNEPEFLAAILKKGWEHDLHTKTILQGDDVAMIIELIEEKLT